VSQPTHPDGGGAGGGAESASLSDYELIVGVCGGIASYKTASFVSAAVQRGAGVTVVMTAAARKFVTPLTFQSLTGRRVFCSLWNAGDSSDPQHLRLTEQADLFIIAPATANAIGKVASGIADDLLTTMVMSADCPVLIAPTMNTRMWDNPIVQRNVSALQQAGYEIVPPGEGWLACRTVGKGRMAEPETLLARTLERLANRPPRKRSGGA
jgi:phosphopantothenoylcysteine decarboxylase/phosphopantothenate--cysteine ligase